MTSKNIQKALMICGVIATCSLSIQQPAYAGLFDFMAEIKEKNEAQATSLLTPQAQTAPSKAPLNLLDWHVSPIIPNNDKAKAYCAMATKYDSDLVLTHARNNHGLGTIAFDFPDLMVEKDNSYLLTVTVGDSVKRVYAARAVKETMLVVRTGNDPVLFDAFSSGDAISLNLDNGLMIQNLTGNTKSFFEFEYCLGGLERPQAQDPVVVTVPVIEEKIVRSPKPLPQDVAEQLDDNIERIEKPIETATNIVENVEWVTPRAETTNDVTTQIVKELVTTEKSKPVVSLDQKAFEDATLAVETVTKARAEKEIQTPYGIDTSDLDNNPDKKDIVLSALKDNEPLEIVKPAPSAPTDQSGRIDQVPLSSLLSIAGLHDVDVTANPEQKGLVSWKEKNDDGLGGSVQHISIAQKVNLNDFIMADLDTIERGCEGEFFAEIGIPEKLGNEEFAEVEAICNTDGQKNLSALIYQLSPELLSIWSIDGHMDQRLAILEDRDNIAEILTQRTLLTQ